MVVHGEERRQRTAAAVLALLPHALLCPAAVLERAVREAVVQAGEQVGGWPQASEMCSLRSPAVWGRIFEAAQPPARCLPTALEHSPQARLFLSTNTHT